MECKVDKGNSVSKGNGSAISMIDRDSQCDFRSLVVTGSTFNGNTAESSYGGAVFLFDNDGMSAGTHSQFVKQLGGALDIYSQAGGSSITFTDVTCDFISKFASTASHYSVFQPRTQPLQVPAGALPHR